MLSFKFLLCACVQFLVLLPYTPVKAQVAAVGAVGQDDDACQDLDGECSSLSENRGCETNAAYMEVFCQRTCDTCRPKSRVSKCEDLRRECAGWGVRGQCVLNPAFMNVNCPDTCSTCAPAAPEDCVDKHRYCFLGSLLGLCRTNPSFYLIFCGDSCRRFIPVCSTRKSSTVRELCNAKDRDQGIPCGFDPTVTSRVKGNDSTSHDVWQGQGVYLNNSYINDGFSSYTKYAKLYNTSTHQGDRNSLDTFANHRYFVNNTHGYEIRRKDLNKHNANKHLSKPLHISSGLYEGKTLSRSFRVKRQNGVHIGNGNGNGNGNNTGNSTDIPTNTTSFNFCIMPLIYSNSSVNICSIFTSTLPIIAIAAISSILSVFSALLPQTQPTQLRFPVTQSPPSQLTPSMMQPTPSQPQTPAPQPPQSPNFPSVDVKIRSLVPFCTASGYMGLVERLKRLTTGNTGRPLNPIAAALAVSVNFCQYGVGDPSMSVPQLPQDEASVVDVFLMDDESTQGLKTPKRWPGISFPALHLYKGYRIPTGHDLPVPLPVNTTQEEEVTTSEDEQPGPRPVTKDNLGERKSFSCGGALISPFHVLTAAHCLIEPGLTENGTVEFLKPSVVRLGEVDFERADESEAFDYEVEGIQVHEGYALPSKYNDIAIITLKYPVEFTEALQPYCLPEMDKHLVGRSCTVSGWGRKVLGEASLILHNVEVVVVSEEECDDSYNDEDIKVIFDIQYPEGINKLLLCATTEGEVCRGDSGGPLVLEEDGVQEEVGVVSTGYGCGAKQYPGIYARVSNYITWLNNEIYEGCKL